MKKYNNLIFAILLLFIVNCTMKIEDCMSQWYQINLPVSGGVFQMRFINSNTGWATVKQSNTNYYLLRTTDSGTNWTVIYNDSAKVENIQFINDSLGYALGQGQGTRLLLKSINKGYNWTIMQSSSSNLFGGFYMVNADTGWISTWSFPSGKIFRTINGFQTIENICTGTGGTPATLYFFKEKFNGEYCGYILGAGILSKTTNSGYNWQQIYFSESGNVNSFSFLNKDTGWVVYNPILGNISKILFSLNAGQNWAQQFYSNINNSLGYIQAVTINRIFCGSIFNKIFVSTNTGLNWGYQLSQINGNTASYINDTLLGFAWNSFQIVRTTNGGGPILLVRKISNDIPKKITLKQNYPNPFNTETTIEFELNKTLLVYLKVYNILGEEIIELVNKTLNPGSYETKFDEGNLPSGIYFYSLFIDGVRVDMKKMLLIK